MLVLLHGGFLNAGSSADFGVRGIVQNFLPKMVVVSVNYRIGAYGIIFFH